MRKNKRNQTKGKRYRLKSGFRFTIFIAAIIVLTVTVVNTAVGFNDVSGQERQQYETVIVEPGDTLWDMADRYMPDDMDTRESVYIIKKHNKDIGDHLIPGQAIKVPINNL